MTTSRALVTGANGFIGRALVRRLVDDGIATDCSARRPWPGAPAGTTWHMGDVTSGAFVDGLVRSCRPDLLFHLAGTVTGSRSLEVVPSTVSTIVVGSVNVLKAATDAGCERVVLIGSGEEPEGADPPSSPYAAAKWAVGGYARMFHAAYGTPVAIARPLMVYGPDQPDATKIVPFTISSLLAGRPPALSSGTRRCDWVYIDDVVDGLLAVAASPACLGLRTDLGTGELRSVRHVVETVRDLVGGDVDPVFGALPDREAETETVADVAETVQRCGWAAQVDLAEGLARTVAWYAAQAGRAGTAGAS